MRITFASEAPIFNGTDLVVTFIALVDGKRVRCAITAEALEDHFGAQSILEDDLLKAFTCHRSRIHHCCRKALRVTNGHAVVLHSGHFRIDEYQ